MTEQLAGQRRIYTHKYTTKTGPMKRSWKRKEEVCTQDTEQKYTFEKDLLYIQKKFRICILWIP